MKQQKRYRARLRGKGQVTLPQELRAELDLHEGEDLVFSINERGQLVAEKQLLIPQEQAWFWSDRWQKLEREVQADIDAGRVTHHEDMEAALRALKG